MNLRKFFPLVLHVVLAAGAVGWSAGLHHTPTAPLTTTYTVTGFAVGLGVTAFVRFLVEVLD